MSIKNGYFRISYSNVIENLICPKHIEYNINSFYIVKTKHGQDIATFLGASPHTAPPLLDKPYKELAFYEDIFVIERQASNGEVLQIEKNKKLSQEYLEIASSKAKELKIPMNLVSSYLFPTQEKIIFNFISEEKKIDFRLLAKELGQILKIKIELHKIYNRDFAALLDEIGSCGKRYCCSSCGTHKKNLPPLSFMGDNNHNVQLGACGKPKCCSSFENNE